jgi:hypothetical protein
VCVRSNIGKPTHEPDIRDRLSDKAFKCELRWSINFDNGNEGDISSGTTCGLDVASTLFTRKGEYSVTQLAV